MFVLGRRQPDLHQTQVAGHAQVADQGADLGIDQKVFGPPLHQHNALPGQAHVQIFGDRPAQAPVTDDDPADFLAFQMRRDSAPGGFDFR